MRDMGLVSYNEPFARLLTQGMVLNEIFFRKPATAMDGGSAGNAGAAFRPSGRIQYFNPADVEVQHRRQGKRIGAVLKNDGQPVESGGIGTMSKSKNNGIDPQALIDHYGADTARLFTMFAAPPEMTLEWSDDGVEGAHRFLKRLWKLVADHVNAGMPPVLDVVNLTASQKDLRRQAHQTLAKVTDDIGRRRTFNTAIASVMELLNALGKFEDASPAGRAVRHEAIEICVSVLSPIVPHATHALWSALGHNEALIDAPWPRPDESALVRDQIELVVQVNGKLRGRVTVPADAAEDKVRELALADEGVQKHIAGKAVKKAIVVPNKLVNIVVAG